MHPTQLLTFAVQSPGGMNHAIPSAAIAGLDTVGAPWMWGAFIVFVLFMLALDLGVFHRSSHEVSFKEAGAWVSVWVTLAMCFSALIAFVLPLGGTKPAGTLALEFLTGYVIELALSVDNLFVILIILSSLQVPKAYQHRILFWGILGALIMRAAFIFMGAALVQKFGWIMYVFGAILLYTGVKLFFKNEDDEAKPTDSKIYHFFTRFLPFTGNFHGQSFFAYENGKRVATPLFMALILVEFTDLIFAVDSIPAIFAVTTDPFIVFTSNIFAILGLRSMFFLLAGIMDRFHLLRFGLAAVLTFIGLKLVGHGYVHIPIVISLVVVVGTLALSIVASLLIPKKGSGAEKPGASPDAVE
ncbi:MAG: putative membrane-bound redox modulator Alx [Myxococcota bacterium]|nr:putative membrane-bound redox modulator Alx [Myxococcota bacterium]